MKRIMIVLLACCLVGVLAGTALAADPVTSGTCGENVTWTLENGTLTISGTGDMTEYSGINGIPWYDNRNNITSVVIEEGVTYIGQMAFYNCENLTGIWVDESNPNYCNDDRGVLFDKDMTTLLKAPNAISGSYCVPNTVTVIAKCAFDGCQSLEQITLPDGLTHIERDAFRSSSLTSITIPKTVESIGDSAFIYCTSLTGIWVDENNREYFSDESGVLHEKYTGVLIQAPGMLSGHYTINSSVRWINSFAFAECSGLTGISIPDSVTNLGSFTFYNCTGLTSVQLPNRITSLGSDTFANCTGLTSVTLPNRLTKIGSFAFENCTSLTDITFPDTLTNIDQGAFRGCSGLTEIVLPENITSISSLSFKGCTSLTDITLPDQLTTIGYSAFEGCASLTDITIPENVTAIAENTFKDCIGLIRITLPDRLTAIKYSTFEGCTSLTDIVIPENVTTIGSYAFMDCTSLTDITIPENVASFGPSVFSGCTSLTNITLPDQLTNFGVCAFQDCTSLTNITVPESVTTITTAVFKGCTGLTDIILPDQVSSVAYTAFDGCTSLTGITIPEGFTYVGADAFRNCGALTDVFYMGTEIQRDAISVNSSSQSFIDAMWHYEVEVWEQDGETVIYCPQCALLYNPDGTVCATPNTIVASDADKTWMLDDAGTLIILENSAAEASPAPWKDYYSSIVRVVFGSRITVGNSFKDCENLKGFLVDNNNPAFCNDEQGVLFDKTMTTLEQAPRAISGSYAVPETVTVIGSQAFCECSTLTEVTLPEGLTEMGPSAFADCSALTKVNIPGSLGIVSSYAFGECHSLKDVTIEEGITSFADSAFYGCSSLENIALPETVVNIGPHAFYGCKSLTNIDFPEGLTHLGLYAFGSCDGLKEVFIPATVTAIGPFVFSNCDNLTGIWVDEDNFRYSSDERGVLFDKEKTCIHKAPYKLSGVYVIPGTVETIVMDAMEGCSDLTGLFLPDSIAYIDEFGVENCPNLSLVHYAGTLEQRNEIEIVSGNNSLLDAQWHYDVVVSEGMAQTAYYCSECDCTYLADGSVYYGITVGGIAVGSGNCADILGDGTASYDLDTNTLTLNNATITVTDQEYGIFAEGDLNIELVGTNKVTIANGNGFYSLYGSVNITGSGSLTIDLTSTGEDDIYGIFCSSNCVVSAKKVTIIIDSPAANQSCGIRTYGDVMLSGTYLKVQAKDGQKIYGIFADGTVSSTCDTAYVSAKVAADDANTSIGICANEVYVNAGMLYALGDAGVQVESGMYLAEGFYVEYSKERFTPGVPLTLTPSYINTYINIGKIVYEISVCDVGVTSANMHDVLGDGTVSYNPHGNELILNNANLHGDIYASYGCNICLMGENTLSSVITEEGGETGAIYSLNGGFKFFGGGSLDLYISAPLFEEVYGIYSIFYCQISDCQISVTVEDSSNAASSVGLLIGGENVNISNAHITINTESGTGFRANAGELNVTNSTICINGGDTAFDSFHGMNLSGELVVTGAAEEFVNGTTTTLTQADPNVPVVIGPKPALVIPTLTGKSFTLSFEDEILVNFYYTVSDLTDVTEHGMLVFNDDPGNVDISDADAVYASPLYDSAKDRYMTTTKGIAAKEMGDTRYYVAYAKLRNGTYVYSDRYDYSPKKYAMNMLKKDTTSEKQKALCVAMLNYGAAAQAYFGYNTSSLMNAELTSEQKAMVIPYDKTLFTGAVAAEDAKVGSFVKTDAGFGKKSVTVSFEGAFAINYYFTPDRAVNGDMTLYYWSAEDYAGCGVLSPWNSTGTVTMTPGADGRYWAPMSGIAAKALDDTYYVVAVYTDGDGNTHCTGVIAYSLSKYCIGKAVSGNAMQELASATAMYGYYAKNYFA